MIFLITTGGFFARLSHTPGGRMFSLFILEIPFLFSLLLWLLFDTPFFEQNKWSCAAVVSLLCAVVYHLQPLHYDGMLYFWQIGGLLLSGFASSFFAFSAAPRWIWLRRLRRWLGELAREVLGRFF